MALNFEIKKCSFEEIIPIRKLFLSEHNFQIRYNACHERSWSDTYKIETQKRIIGYASIKGKDNLADRDTIFEYYLIPLYRRHSAHILDLIIAEAKPTFIENQTNENFLSNFLFERTKNIQSDVILFEDDIVTNHIQPNVVFRKRLATDDIFESSNAYLSDFILEKKGVIVAFGGFLLHYNEPFADLFMEVKKSSRGEGLATFILQEIKKECYLAGRIPAARCNIDNIASKKALLKAGFKIVGHMAIGEIK